MFTEPLIESTQEFLRFSLWCEAIRRKIRQDMDELILIAGTPGKGKSTFSYWLGLCLDETFDHTRIAMQGEAFIDILEDAPRYGAVINDEPIEGLFSREHASKPNRAFARWSWIMRGRNLIMLINANEIRWMDPMVRDSRANWVWHVKDHGYAVLYMASRPDDLWAEGTRWVPLFAVTYPKITPEMIPDWGVYLEMKDNRLYKTNVRRKKQIKDAKQVVEKPEKKDGREMKPCPFCDGPKNGLDFYVWIKQRKVYTCHSCERKLMSYRAKKGASAVEPSMLEIYEKIIQKRDNKKKAKKALR